VFCQTGPLLNQVLGDDRYRNCGRGGWKLQPRGNGREPKIWPVQDQTLHCYNSYSPSAELGRKAPKRCFDSTGLVIQTSASTKQLFDSKSFQLFLSFGRPCSVGPLKSPIKKPPGWGQFFCQDHWRPCQSQCQKSCVPPALASLPVQFNCRE